jgi:uncharacterized repeat protein (TIGR01451 family)
MSFHGWKDPRRWAGLLAVAILVAFCFILLGSHTAAAQKDPSSPLPSLDKAGSAERATSSSFSPVHPPPPEQLTGLDRVPHPGQDPLSRGWWQNSGAPPFSSGAQPQGMAPLTPPLPDGVDQALCQSTDRAWGVVGAGETATVTVDGAQMGAAVADGNGFFWTTLYDAGGDRPGLAGGETVAIYHDGTQAANVTVRTIIGNIDVEADTVNGTIGGVSSPINVTVYVGTNEPSLVSYSQTVSTNGSGAFQADFSGVFDLLSWHNAMVAYIEDGVEVHQHVYPGPSLLVRPSPWDDLMGTSFVGTIVTATVYDSGWSMKISKTLEADPASGWYSWDEPGDLLAGDIVVVDMAGGWTLSRTVQVLSLSVDPVTDQVTGLAEPGQVVRGVTGGVTPNGWRDVWTSTTADATTGAYTLDFGGLTDIMPGQWAGVFAADAEGDDLNLWHYSPSVEVHQTWNQVRGAGPAPSPPEAPGRMVTLTLASGPEVFSTQMGWGGWYEFNQDVHDLPDIGPGEIVTVEAEGYAWQGVVEVKEMTVGHDVDADQFTGTVQPPGDRVELNGSQWQSWMDNGSLYPVGGSFDTVTTASSAFTASPAGFDVRNTVEYDVLHRTANDYLEMIYSQVDYLRVWPQYNGTLGHLGPPGTSFTLTLRTGDGTFKGELTGTSGEPTGDIGWNPFWPTGEQMMPGDQLQAQSAAGFDQTVHIPDIVLYVDDVDDVVSGSAPPNSLLYVQVEGDQGQDKGWVPTGADGQFAVAVDQLQQVQDGDLAPNDGIMVCYANEDANQVCRNYEAPWTRANYGQDWVGANYPAGHTFWITVTDSTDLPKGYATIDSEPGQGWGGDGFQTDWEHWVGGEPPDILPFDWVHFRSDDGYNHSLQVGTVDGTIDTATDSVSGPIDVPWFVGVADTLNIECHPWGAPDENTPTKESSAGPDGDPEYLCQWNPNTEWDVQPGQEIAVMYVEPDDGDRVMNVFWEPAPDMRVEKWPEGSDQVAAGGFAVFNIRYRNEGDAVAQTVLLTDTLPPGTIYTDDSSGDPSPAFGPGTVTWHLGPMAPGEERQFQLVLEIPSDPDPTLLNQADIWAEYDFRDWNNHAEAEVYVSGDVWYDPYVDKRAEPNEPAPGGTYVYEIDYGNNGPVPTGPSTLVDALPSGTSVVDWYSENGYTLWTEVSRNGQLVLETPTLPGYWGDRIVLRLAVSPAVEIGTQLTNTVELDIPVGFASSMNNNAWVRGPYWDSHLDKNFGWGVLVPGGEVEFNVHMRNGGNQPAHTWLTDTLPSGTSFAQSWRWDGQHYVEWAPSQIIGNQVIWDMGEMLPGQWYNLDIRLDIDPGVTPGTSLENCAQIGIDGDDQNPFNDQDCAMVTIREMGTNMRVYKEHEWQDDNQVLRYEIRVENVGTERLENVLIYDTYPEFTTFNDEWGIDHGPWITLTHDELNGQLVFWAEQFEPGETASINVRVNLDEPEARPRWYTNTVEVPVAGDIWTEDNLYQDVAVKGELDRVELWIEPYGPSNMWGEAEPGAKVTVTTPVSVVTTIVGNGECDRCWRIDDVGPIQPGDIVDVRSGAGLLPVIVDIPDPIDADASSSADTVSGQVGGWLEERLEIHGNWPNGYLELLTDGSGKFLATFGDVPPRADGYIRFQTWVDFAEVIFHRPFRDMDPLLDVNYVHDWISADYAPDHTIWLTVTESDGTTIVDAASVQTAPMPEWGGNPGFSVNMDVDAGDWVYSEVDTGQTSSVQVGTIVGGPSAALDRIRGTVDANWISQQVKVECHPWGAGHEAPNKYDSVFPDGTDFYTCAWDPDTEWDIQPYEDIGVSYDDPTGHRIYAAFQVRSQIHLPLVFKNH